MSYFNVERPSQVTGSVTAAVGNFPTGFNANITASITLPVSATNPVTASVANFPVGFNANITASVTLPVSATNPVTASVSNFPTVIRTYQSASSPSQGMIQAAAASTLIKAANANRLGLAVYNSSSAKLYLNLGPSASLSGFSVIMGSYTYYETPFGYAGAVYGYWESAAGSASYTEITA